MNITRLNFTDEDFKKLVDSYLKILMYAISIDNNIHKKEVNILLSLLTKVDLWNDNLALSKLNYFHNFQSLKKNLLNIDKSHFDYVKVLDLENIIFWEAEKSLHLILSKLSKKIDISFEEKMIKLEKYLNNIKNIIESKREVLWEEYLNIFYYWIYFYSKLIAEQVWKFFWDKIVEEEKKYLEKIKNILQIEDKINESSIEKLRIPSMEI